MSEGKKPVAVLEVPAEMNDHQMKLVAQAKSTLEANGYAVVVLPSDMSINTLYAYD